MWTSMGQRQRCGGALRHLTQELVPAQQNMLQHFWLPETQHPPCLDSNLLISHILFFSPILYNSFVPRSLNTDYPKLFSLTMTLPFPQALFATQFYPLCSCPVLPRSLMVSAPTSILRIEYTIYCYDSAVPFLAQELTLPGCRIYCLRNFFLEGRKKECLQKRIADGMGPSEKSTGKPVLRPLTFGVSAL